MQGLELLNTRRSIRKFQDKDINDEILYEIIQSGMYAPTAGNQQPWHFIIIKDKQIVQKIVELNPNATMSLWAPVNILICWDTTNPKFNEYWMQDCAAATQNILLATHALGLGAVWTWVYPVQSRIDWVRQILNIPENIIPFAFVPIGYPDMTPSHPKRFDANKIHNNKW